jgi:hypothetical protein
LEVHLSQQIDVSFYERKERGQMIKPRTSTAKPTEEREMVTLFI